MSVIVTYLFMTMNHFVFLVFRRSGEQSYKETNDASDSCSSQMGLFYISPLLYLLHKQPGTTKD